MVEINGIEILSDDSSDDRMDDEEIERRRKLFVRDMNALSGKKTKRKKKSTRNEASTEISEFTWSSSKDDSTKLNIRDLLEDVKTNKNAEVKKKLRKMENTMKTLDKPLTKPETERVEREAAYKTTKKEVSKWQPTVQKNREADQLVFPMNQYRAPIVSTKSIARDFKPKNDLEREISAVLNGSKHILERDNKELTAAEEEALKTFDLEDAIARRKELQKSRALQSYYEAKCRRMKKIKSKKYHKIQRKAEEKALGKVDLETLSKENPELFQSELEKAERLRALERANLRHRNTSKWAKNLIIKGNHKTKEDQERIREQLRVSRELTNNKQASDSDVATDDDAEEEENTGQDLNLLVDENSDNPWLLSHKDTDNNKETSKTGPKRYRKIEAIRNDEIDSDDENESDDVRSSADEWDAEMSSNDEKTTRRKKISKMKLSDGSTLETKKTKKSKKTKNANKSENIKNDKSTELSKVDKVTQDPLRFIREDDDALPLQTMGGDSSEDEVIYDTEQRMNIREAFANDDVVADFMNEKKELVENSKPKPVDLTLPGWGEWGGAGLQPSAKKRKRFTQPAEKMKKRRDEEKANVIISEGKNEKLSKHLVSQVPFPYSSKEEFERSIRQPIGDTWNTPSVYNKLIEPRIKTNPGEIIQPIKASKSMKKKNKKREKK